jgi:peptide/nickel transport system substrate-binding protein
MNRRLFVLTSLLLVVVFVLAACGSGATPSQTVEPTTVIETVEAQAPTPPGQISTPGGSETSNILTAAHSEYAFTYDPLYSNWSDVARICVVAYDALVKYDPTTKQIVPWVASEWEVSPDMLSYTFKINEGIKFHDGSDLTASDIKYTFERIIALNDGVASSLIGVASVEAVAEYTVKVNMKQPDGSFLMSMPQIFIINEDGVKAHEVEGDWGAAYLVDNDLGSGPYYLASSIPEQQSVFSKYADYWKGWEGKHIDGITFLWIKDSATQRLMLESGELDIMMQPLVDDLSTFATTPGYQVLTGDSPVIMAVAFRVTHPPLDDIRVRKALAMAIDSNYHLEVALGGYGKLATGPLASVLPFFNTEIPLMPFDIEGAKALMSEAGLPNGGFTVKLAYESENEEKQRALEMLQSNWGQLGVQIEPMGMDFMAQASMMADKNSEPDVYIDYIWPTAPDPDPALRPFFYGPLKDFGNNAAYWSDPEVDKLFDAGLAESDQVKREEIYKQIQQLIYDAHPEAWMTENPFNIVAQSYVKGYIYNPALHQALDVYNMQLDGKP